MSVQSLRNTNVRGVESFDEGTLLKEIEETQTKVESVVRNTRWPLIEEAHKASTFYKLSSVRIGNRYLKIADHYYKSDDPISVAKADEYWQKSLESLKGCSTYPSVDEEIDYQNWVELSALYFRYIQVHLHQLSGARKVELISEGLESVNQALKIRTEAVITFRKYLFLQLLEEAGQTPPEFPILWLKIFLDIHPEPISQDYFQYAHLYGGELAKKGCLGASKVWFEELLQTQEHSLTYLYLGKIEDQQNNAQLAIEYFQKAKDLAPKNKETTLWLISEEVKGVIRELRQSQKLPSEEKLKEIVELFNRFCATFSECRDVLEEETSTFATIGELAGHFYLTLIPEMANILAHLQQFPFALYLYEAILEGRVAFGITDPAELSKLHATIGGLYLQKEKLEEAERHLNEARKLTPNCLPAYENLVAVYASQKNEENLNKLWISVQPLLTDDAFDGEQESIGSLLFNFGTAYALLMKNKDDPAGDTAIMFYERALKYDSDNWDVKLHLARILVIKSDGLASKEDAKEEWKQARDLLVGFDKYERDLPFGVNLQQKFQVSFCLSGAYALCGDVDLARTAAIEAGKMRYSPDEVHNLQSYLQAFHKGDSLVPQLQEQIVESIRKMGFSFRVGKVINKNSIIISGESSMGYHGTIDCYIDELKEGVKPKKVAVRQFSGEGFYIATDREAACYFAKKKQKEEKKGEPVVLEIYAASDQGLVGQNVSTRARLTKEVTKQYDFVKSYIDGLEAFSQYYVLENSLKKLRVLPQVTQVNWTDGDYEQFISHWKR